MKTYLDGEALPGYDHRVTAQGRLVRKDQSGETDGTGSTHEGWKAWVIGVSCKVRFSDGADLTRLRELFQARDDAGAPFLYDLVDDTAKALGVTRARFSDFFQVDPDESLRIWHVKFTLIEESSIPQLTSERTPPATATAPGAPAGTTDTAGQPAAAAPEGWGEKLLALLEKFASRFSPAPPEG